MQEIFIKIFDKISQFNGEGSFEGWMKRIAMSSCIDFLRKNKFTASEDVYEKYDLKSENEEEEEDIVSQLLEMGFNKEMLLQMMHRLNEKQRLIFNLFCIDHLSHKEIAEKLNITEVYSRKILFNAKNEIKEMLIQYLQTQHNHILR